MTLLRKTSLYIVEFTYTMVTFYYTICSTPCETITLCLVLLLCFSGRSKNLALQPTIYRFYPVFCACRISWAIYIAKCQCVKLLVLLACLMPFYVPGEVVQISSSMKIWLAWSQVRAASTSAVKLTPFSGTTLALAWKYSSLIAIASAMEKWQELYLSIKVGKEFIHSNGDSFPTWIHIGTTAPHPKEKPQMGYQRATMCS